MEPGAAEDDAADELMQRDSYRYGGYLPCDDPEANGELTRAIHALDHQLPVIDDTPCSLPHCNQGSDTLCHYCDHPFCPRHYEGLPVYELEPIFLPLGYIDNTCSECFGTVCIYEPHAYPPGSPVPCADCLSFTRHYCEGCRVSLCGTCGPCNTCGQTERTRPPHGGDGDDTAEDID